MPTVLTSHKRFLSVPESFKGCVSTKNAKTDGGRELEKALNYFTEKIKEVERKVIDATKIVEFLVTRNDENLMNNYYFGTKTSRIRTAVVKCNFTDSETLMRSVEDKCKEHKVDRVIVSSHATSVQGALEEIKEKHRHTIIVIEQLESMDIDVFNRLISLLSYENLRRTSIKDSDEDMKDKLDVSLLVCICTSRSAFRSHCVGDNFDLLFPKFFPLASPQEQFEQVAMALIRNEDKKAPKLYLSGDLLLLIKNRFLYGDFSLSELKKIVRLAIVKNFLNYDSYIDNEEDDFPERVPVYWKWFEILTDLINATYEETEDNKESLPNKIDLHTELQRYPNAFWADNKTIADVRNLLCQKNREELCEWIEVIASNAEEVSPEESKTLSDRAAALRASASAAAPAAPSTPSQTALTTARKMTMSELLAANRAKQEAAKSGLNELRAAVGEVVTVMKGQLFSWRGHDDYLLNVPEGIEIPDLSKSLMTQTNKPLSQAFTALAGIDQFKAVPLARWGQMVADRVDNGEFYDCVAQLERMGMIKDMSKQGKKAAMVQFRPMKNFN
ncbi:hypothetical protein PMAYCL1PPCAC_13244 [Pristionchus mayeri]|uniref:Origin recognition complex subunit 3 N-terminal domain-containing protein n=1 Tax=Pristionchus mayeri TaxID=1317129 RepID=A0AAN4ZPH5_9BILA|nr:hypothetical protein PMAYCL1PPCAC_13244 [Pristionchus mayeri]